MTINIRASDMELTEAIRTYIEEKFTMLEKYAHDIVQVDVHVGRDTNHHNKGKIHSCTASVSVKGNVVRVERSEEDLYKAIDKVKDHLRETLSQRKERMVDGKKADEEI
jgi:putative sigma-54 modulation protein